MSERKTPWISIIAIVLVVMAAVGVAVTYADYSGSGNNTTKDKLIIVEKPVIVDNKSTNGGGTPIINNNTVIVNNTIIVPTAVQPTITPTNVSSDEKLLKIEKTAKKKIVAPVIRTQETTVIKSSNLYTGTLVKYTNDKVEKKGLVIKEINTGLTGCEYIILENQNSFDMGLGGYQILNEYGDGIQLPNLEIRAGKSIKMFTVNGKPDTYNADGSLQKYHFRLAKELYPDDESINVYLIEPNFGDVISEITT